MSPMYSLVATLVVATASAANLKDSVRAALGETQQPGRIAKQLKCTQGETTATSTMASCAECGCVACPCCISGGLGCPDTPDWDRTTPSGTLSILRSAKCTDLDFVSNEPNDPLSCATDSMPHDHLEETCNVSSKEECQKVIDEGGNLCAWYNLWANGAGKCAYNPCSDVNDGSCTIQKTGGRCVWYGNPQHLNTIERDGEWIDEIPNPYGDNSGCYMSPCDNPVNNTARGCEEQNNEGGYQCQWCYNHPNKNRPGLGCQNMLLDSVARPAVVGPLQSEGHAPCGNYYCNFFEFEHTIAKIKGKTKSYPTKRTNSDTKYDQPIVAGSYPTPCGENCNQTTTYTWKGAFGDGTAANQCTCPYNWGKDGTASPVCPSGIPVYTNAIGA